MKRIDFFIILFFVAMAVGFSSFALGKFRGLDAGKNTAVNQANAALLEEQYGIRFRITNRGDISLVHPMVISARKLAEMSWQADKPVSRKAGLNNE